MATVVVGTRGLGAMARVAPGQRLGRGGPRLRPPGRRRGHGRIAGSGQAGAGTGSGDAGGDVSSPFARARMTRPASAVASASAERT